MSARKDEPVRYRVPELLHKVYNRYDGCYVALVNLLIYLFKKQISSTKSVLRYYFQERTIHKITMATTSSDIDPDAIASATAEAKRKAIEKTAKEKETCESYVKSGIQRNVTVQFLYDRLAQLGCKPPDNLIRCLDCKDAPRVGGFGAVEEIDVSSSSSSVHSNNKNDSCAQTKQSIDELLSKQKDGEAKLRLVPEIYLCQQHLRNETHAHEAMVVSRELSLLFLSSSWCTRTYTHLLLL